MRTLAAALLLLFCLASPASADIRIDPPARRIPRPPPTPSPRPATPPTTEAPRPSEPPRPAEPPAPEPKKREGLGHPMAPEWLFGLGVLALGLGGLYRSRPRRDAVA